MRRLPPCTCRGSARALTAVLHGARGSPAVLRPRLRGRRLVRAVHPGSGVGRGPALGSGTKAIQRPRPLARLEEPLQVAVLAAPAGYGKTLLASQLAARGPGPTLFCRLYPEDRDPIHLIDSLI